MNPSSPAYQSQLAHIDQDKGPRTISASGILIGITTIAVTGRLVAQRLVKPSLLADDYCVIIALVLCIGLCIDLILCVHYGLGKHVVAVEKEDPHPPLRLINIFKTGYSMSVVNIPALFVVKLSLLLFYRRVFTTHQKKIKWTFWLLIFYITAWVIASLVVFLMQCIPVRYFWDRSYALIGQKPPVTGWCLPNVLHQAAVGIFNTVSDLLILVFPAIALWPLRMPRMRKLGLFFIFSLGAFVCAVSIVKICYAFAVNNSEDSSYINNEILLWTVVEPCIGLVCACIPCMMPLSQVFTKGPRNAFRQRYGKSFSGGTSSTQATIKRPFPSSRRFKSSHDDVDHILTKPVGYEDLELQGVEGGALYSKDDINANSFEGNKQVPVVMGGTNQIVGGWRSGDPNEVPEGTIRRDNGVQLTFENEE
ncbi:MAG: hypothetical protein Q9157_002179 [Trypethelium eluteriae]